MPLYISHIGGTEQQVGLVMGAFAIGLISSRPQLGTMADGHSRKRVLLIGLGVAAAAPLGYLLLPSVPMVFGLRAFHGISVAAFTTAYNALVVDFAPPQQRAEVLGGMSLVTPLGLALGPALGGFLVAARGYDLLFTVAMILAGVGIGCMVQVDDPMARRPSPVRHCPPTPPSGVWQLLGQPRLRSLTMVMFCVGGTFGTLTTFMPLYITQLGIGFNPGWYYTAAAIASFGVRLGSGRVADRLGRGRFITLSLLLYGASMLVLWQWTTPMAFLLSGILEGSGGGLLVPMMAAVLADRAGTEERGRVFSVCMGGFDIGIALAGPVFGTFSQQLGLANVFLGASLLSLLALGVFFTSSNPSLVASLRFALGNSRDRYALPLDPTLSPMQTHD